MSGIGILLTLFDYFYLFLFIYGVLNFVDLKMLFLSRFVLDSKHFGVVLSSKDNIAGVHGLLSVTSGEMVSDAQGNMGLVLNLEAVKTGIVMFTENSLMGGDCLTRSYNTLSTCANPHFILSNVFDSIGNLVNKESSLSNILLFDFVSELGSLTRGVELKAPGIIIRQPVYESLSTGNMGVDGILPLGQGQRELVIGDRQTGKTAIVVDTILNQANLDVSFSSHLCFIDAPKTVSSVSCDSYKTVLQFFPFFIENNMCDYV